MTVIYDELKSQFIEDVDSINQNIEDLIENRIYDKMKKGTGIAEKRSWRNSLQEMYKIIKDDDIPYDSRISIEYNIPNTGKRIDFIISGTDENGQSTAVIIELKQREYIDITDQDGTVITWVAKANREELHPSYQVWSYSNRLNSYSTFVDEEPVELKPCAFLHNYPHRDNKIDNEFYSQYLDLAPIFVKDEKEKLREFIKKYIKHGDKKDVIYCIDNGEIKPTVQLVDKLNSMLDGNPEFILLDEQKQVFERARKLIKQAQTGNKKVLIVKGGPGTGKSVVAIQLLGAMNKERIIAHYVSKNASVRGVYSTKLAGKYKKCEIDDLFKGSGTYTESLPNEIGCLIVDEAHRLNEKSGLFSNLGENQVKEIINASHCSIFFIDEDQKVTLKDIGTMDEILKWANYYCADVEIMELVSQFRCGGSDGYLAWLDNTLGIRETANISLNDLSYDFRVFDSPNELKHAIFGKNKLNNNSRLVAGYCWNRIKEGKNNTNVYDIVIDDYPEPFKMSWNLGNTTTYAIDKTSINEVGCIHTVQGLEFDYVGVIIGDDFIVRNGKIITNPDNRAKTDQSIKGWKKLTQEKGADGEEELDKIIKNTYRVLMSRGRIGCYIYCTDGETREYFKRMMN